MWSALVFHLVASLPLCFLLALEHARCLLPASEFFAVLWPVLPQTDTPKGTVSPASGLTCMLSFIKTLFQIIAPLLFPGLLPSLWWYSGLLPVVFCGTQGWTQGHSRADLCPHPFWDRVSLNCAAWSETCDPPALASQVAAVIGIHYAWLSFLFTFFGSI